MVFRGDGSVLSVDDRFGEGKTDPVARGVFLFAAVEAVKDVVELFRLKTCAAVLHRELRIEQGILAGNLNFPTVARALHTVFQNIFYGLREPSRVACDTDIRRHVFL